MAYSCLLDQLPIELLHLLFKYFRADEICFTLFDVTNRLNSVLQSYTDYYVDLKSTGKSQYDLICRYIQSEQIISLTFSDDINTYSQSEFFFSYFQIENFTKLRSLTLLEIDFELLKYIFSNLHKFNRLSSFSFDNGLIKYKYPLQTQSSINDYLMNINSEVLSKVNSLHFSCANFPPYTILPYLRHLKLKECTNDELYSIFQHVSQLKSLSVCLNLDNSQPQLNFSPKHLTRMSLEIKFHRISMSEIKEILLKMPNLKHLELKLYAKDDIVDGYQWQTLTTSLITFYFKFTLLFIKNYDILDSFRTRFWLEEKRWFVAYRDGSLFSIPHFAPVSVDSFKLSSFYSTAPDNSLICNHVNRFSLNTKNINCDHRLNHVKTLVLQIPISFSTIKETIDLSQVEHLILPSLNNISTFISLRCKLPQLYKLTIANTVTDDMIPEIKCYDFVQILKLQISINNESNRHLMNKLFRLFPCIQHLNYSSPIQSKATMFRLINGFNDLSNASFYVDNSFITRESKFCRRPNTIIEHSKRLIKNNFICRIYEPSMYSAQYNIVWWIGESLSTKF